MFKVRTGETLTLKLVTSSGNISGVSTAICKMKKAGLRGSIPPSSAPVIATFNTINLSNGWDFVLPANITQTLEAGLYIADASLTLTTGEIDKTGPITIEVLLSVS